MGGGDSEGWSGRSDDVLDAEQGRGYSTLTASKRGTQESGAGGLRVDEQACGSDGWKAPYTKADKAGTQDRHWARQGQQKKRRLAGI